MRAICVLKLALEFVIVYIIAARRQTLLANLLGKLLLLSQRTFISRLFYFDLFVGITEIQTRDTVETLVSIGLTCVRLHAVLHCHQICQ